MWIAIIASAVALIILSVVIFLNHKKFGKLAKNKRLERIKKSPNYIDGVFRNLDETQQITSDRKFATVADFLFKKHECLRPEGKIVVTKTNLHELNPNDDILVWFGHSSCLLQTEGVRVLVDPVFFDASPVSFINKAFDSTAVFTPDDMPQIDYLIISHDHWDHLDYKTVLQLKNKVNKIICGLGVGAHFEHWGFDLDKVVEMDWNDSVSFDNGFTIHCLPAQHFSGRGLNPNKSLWASYMLETLAQKIYIGGDSGYGSHYAEIGKRFGGIDLAIMENGQYNEDWGQIHILPKHMTKAFKELNAKKLITVHHGKYALAKHPWDEPMKNIAEMAERDSIDLIMPAIGQIVNFNDSVSVVNKWWTSVE